MTPHRLRTILRIAAVAGIAALTQGCRPTSSPEQAADAGIFFPSNAGSTWVYTLAANNQDFRTAVKDTTIGGIYYHLFKDSTTIYTNGIDTFYIGYSLVRSDENAVYDIVRLDPLLEETDLDTRVGQTWQVLKDTTITNPAVLSSYQTIALLPTFSVKGITYSNVLQVEQTDTFPARPDIRPTIYENYYAKGIGGIEVYDSTDHILSFYLTSYQLK